MDCLSKEEKEKYFNEINKFYKYDNSIVESMINDKKQLCNYDYTNKIKQINNKDKNNIIFLLRKIKLFLDDYNIEYWIDSGTLLGAVRNGKIIPWDDDIDLAIPKESYEKLYKIILNLKKNKIKNILYYISEKHKIKFSWSIKLLDKSASKSIYKLNYPSMIFAEHTDINLPYKCDLIMYFKEGNKYITNYPPWINVFYYNINDIYPLKKIKFENNYYNCVNNPIPFLNNAYWFWKDIGVASHAHNKDLKNTRNKTIYFKFSNNYINKLSLKNISLKNISLKNISLKKTKYIKKTNNNKYIKKSKINFFNKKITKLTQKQHALKKSIKLKPIKKYMKGGDIKFCETMNLD